MLDARLAHSGATLADLYDPNVMPPDLRKAHHSLDAIVDKLYRAAPFASDRDILNVAMMTAGEISVDCEDSTSQP